MLIGIVTTLHMTKLKPFKPHSPACVAVAYNARSPAMSSSTGAASSTDVNAFSAQAGTVTPTTANAPSAQAGAVGDATGQGADASSAQAGTASRSRWTKGRKFERPDIDDDVPGDLPLAAFPTEPPSAQAGVLDAVDGEGFDISVARASVLGFYKFRRCLPPFGWLPTRSFRASSARPSPQEWCSVARLERLRQASRRALRQTGLSSTTAPCRAALLRGRIRLRV